jgi:predicted transcriptional regulator
MRRAAAPREIPPPLEVECLKALWELGQGNVKDVREVLTRNRNLAYTTVMTVLERLTRRGGVSRKKVGRSFVYAPAVTRETLRELAVKEFVDRFFDGSPEALLAFLKQAPPAAGGPPAAEEQLDPTLL